MATGTTHIVVQGEYLSMIARAHGFASYHTIWNAPENKELKDRRKNPNILFPGDELFIPDKETREESRGTEAKHRFELQVADLKLCIRLLGFDGKPVASHECTLVVENELEDLTTDAAGGLRKEVPHTAAVGKLLDRAEPGQRFSNEEAIPLKIGYLDPADTVSGQVARLNNLGYDAADLPGPAPVEGEERAILDSPEFISAVEEFQCDHGLKVDGKCGPKTQDKLIEIHGC
jgi:hypothetical protein